MKKFIPLVGLALLLLVVAGLIYYDDNRSEAEFTEDSASADVLEPGQPFGPQIQIGCQVVTKGSFDPILDPPDTEAHRHVFYGNTSINKDSTFKSLHANLGTSCNEAVETSSYWHPVLIDGASVDKIQEPASVTFYAQAPGDQTKVENIPGGLELIGNVTTGDNPEVGRDIGVTYRCGEDPTQPEPPYGCDRNVRLTVDFPNCWDGIDTKYNAESPHVVWGGANCPSTHPHRLPSMSLRIRYPNPDGNWQANSYVSAGANTWRRAEVSMHSDLFFAAQLPEFDDYIEQCLRQVEDDEERPPQCNPG